MDAFAHFSAIEGEAFREVTVGERVEFDCAPVQQDSVRIRATRVRRLSSVPVVR